MAFFWHTESSLFLRIWGCHDISGHLIKHTICVYVCACTYVCVRVCDGHLDSSRKPRTEAMSATGLNFVHRLILSTAQ